MSTRTVPPDAGLLPHEVAQGPVLFGKYTLLRRIASGGMAELFLALQRSVAGFEKLVVIKRILPSVNQDKEFIELLLHEAKVAATLTHPNLVQTFDVGQVDGTYYIAMEHIHGEDVRSMVRQMRKKGVTSFPPEHALFIAMGVCAGLAYAHEQRTIDGHPMKLVHRDISPQNVVVTYTGDVKIVDFGVAQSTSSREDKGSIKGKVPYMSPEQVRAEPLDHRSDIFAVGVVLYELTTGRRLFKAATDKETARLIVDGTVPLPSDVLPGYPKDLELIVLRALRTDRDARYASARAMQEDLEKFARDHRLATSSIRLGQFMSDLFDDKLREQEAALAQGKKLADVLAAQGHDLLETMPPPGHFVGAPPPGYFGPATGSASKDFEVTRREKAPLRPSRRKYGVLLALAVATAGGSYAWAYAHRPPPKPPAEILGNIRVTTMPAGATLSLDGEPYPAATPVTLGELRMGPHRLRVSLEGYESKEEVVTLDPSFRDVELPLELRAIPKLVDAGASDAGKPQPVGEGWKRPSAPSVADAGAEAVAPKPTAPGQLSVSSTGAWCELTVDGVAHGATPVAGITLAAGKHTLVCKPPEGPAVRAVVDVPAGGTLRHKFTTPSE